MIVLKELQDAGRKGGLSGIEIIDGVVMADEEWTAQNVSESVLRGFTCTFSCGSNLRMTRA